MKLKLGADPKKIVILGGLLLVLGYLVYDNFSGNEPRRTENRRPAPAPTAATPRVTIPIPQAPQAVATSRSRARGGLQEFKPRIGARRPEERLDPVSIDPTLRLDLIARLQSVKLEGGHRSLFEFSQAPVQQSKDTPIIKPKPIIGPAPPPPAETSKNDAPPPKPPPPPINLKFYGYINSPRQAARRAFFLDGDDILVAGEGELIKKRYKVVRIGVNSAVVEDVEHKHQQTLPLIEQPQT